MHSQLENLSPKKREAKIKELAELGNQNKLDIFPDLEEAWKKQIASQETTTISLTTIASLVIGFALGSTGAGAVFAAGVSLSGAAYFWCRALRESKWKTDQLEEGNYEELVTADQLKDIQRILVEQKPVTPEAKAFKVKAEKLLAHYEEVADDDDSTVSHSANSDSKSKVLPNSSSNSPSLDLYAFLKVVTGSSALIASVRGTGKTTLLEVLFNLAEHGFIKGLDPKNSLSLGTLKPYFTYVSPVEKGIYLNAIEAVYNELVRRNSSGLPGTNFKPLWLVIDEYQSTYSGWDDKTKKRATELISAIINTGRERRVFVVLVSQSPLCSDIGLSTGQRDNLAVIALGCDPQPPPQGGGGWNSVERLIESHHIIPSSKSRKALTEQYDAIKAVKGSSTRVLASVEGLFVAPDWSRQHYEAMSHQVWSFVIDESDDNGPQFIAKPVAEAKSTRWAIAKKEAEDTRPEIAQLMSWIDGQRGGEFPYKRARTNKDNLAAMRESDIPGESASAKLKRALEELVGEKLLEFDGLETYQVSQYALSESDG